MADFSAIVSSGWVQYIGWVGGKLVIQFNNGDCAEFQGVPEEVATAAILSGSPGSFVNQWLRGIPYRKIPSPFPLTGDGECHWFWSAALNDWQQGSSQCNAGCTCEKPGFAGTHDLQHEVTQCHPEN